MNETPNMRERLLSAGSVDPGLKEQYEKELRDMIHAQLSTSQRWLYGALSALSLLLAVGFGILADRMTSLDIAIRLIMVVASVKCMAEGIRVGIVVYKGQFDRTKTSKWLMGAIYLGAVSALWFVYAMRADRTGVPPEILIMMFLPILAAMIVLCVGWVLHRISLAELRNKEEMLEVKLQLTAIARQLEEKGQ